MGPQASPSLRKREREVELSRNMSPMSGKGIAFTAGAVVLVLVGCAGPKVTLKRASQLEQYRVSSIVVLPFEAVTTPQAVGQRGPELSRPPEVVKSDISAPGPDGIARLGQQTTIVPPGADMKVARIFARKLRTREALTVVPPQDVESAVAALEASDPSLPPEEVARRLALDFKADAAVAGLLRVYKEREGSKYGAVPAVVGFEVTLVASDGQVLWSGAYYEEQRPIFEDISGLFAHGFGFVTAEDLATYGAEELVKEFPFGQ